MPLKIFQQSYSITYMTHSANEKLLKGYSFYTIYFFEQ